MFLQTPPSSLYPRKANLVNGESLLTCFVAVKTPILAVTLCTFHASPISSMNYMGLVIPLSLEACDDHP